ncbi:MAG: sigma factor-like helix-turn-helix DNA-binding protein [Methanospirillum sp.]
MGKTTDRNIEAAIRRRRALELRRQGWTYEAIAVELGVSPQAAHKAVSKALTALTAEPAADLRRLELDRLDALTRAAWSAAASGNLPAIDRILRVMERRAKLAHLDEPVIEQPDVSPLVEIKAAITASLAVLEDHPPTTIVADETEPSKTRAADSCGLGHKPDP